MTESGHKATLRKCVKREREGDSEWNREKARKKADVTNGKHENMGTKLIKYGYILFGRN